MMRLKIAKQQLRSFMADIRDLNGHQMPGDVAALARLREAIALIDEVELATANRRFDHRDRHMRPTHAAMLAR
ncbi:MAG TPA: hypothetical protein VIY48_20005 [Candidatus Paceibacterota bacterium]